MYIYFILQIANDAKGETITLASGSLSGLMVYPKVTLNRGLYFCQSRCHFLYEYDFQLNASWQTK